jgi:hypothetical protein
MRMFEPDHGRGRLHGRSLYDALGSDFMVPALDRYGLAKRGGGLRASPLTPKNSTIKKRGQLLSFLFAVAPNRTMSL